MKKDDIFNFNKNKNIQSNINQKYNKYIIDDENSNISEDAIEVKMNRIIQIKKNQNPKEKIIIEPLNLENLKKNADNFKKKNIENKEKKEKDNQKKIQNGLKEFEKKFKKFLIKRFIKKLNFKINLVQNLKKGFEKLISVQKTIKKKNRKKIFVKIKNIWEKEKNNEEKRKREEEKRKREEEKRKREEEKRKRDEEKKKREEEKRKREEEKSRLKKEEQERKKKQEEEEIKKKQEEERKKTEEENKKKIEEENKKKIEENKIKMEEEKRKKEEDIKKKKEDEKKKNEEEEKQQKKKEKKRKKKEKVEKKKEENEEKKQKKKEKKNELKKEDEKIENENQSKLRVDSKEKESKKKSIQLIILDLEEEEKKEEEKKGVSDNILYENIEIKKQKLEEKKNKQIQYIKLLEEQKKIRETNVKDLDSLIDEQIKKQKKLKNGLNVSKTDSFVDSDLENDEKFENSLINLGFSIQNNKKPINHKNEHHKKGSMILDNLNMNKLRENEALYDLNENFKIRKTTKKKTERLNDSLRKFRIDDNNSDNSNKDKNKIRKNFVKKITMRNKTIKDDHIDSDRKKNTNIDKKSNENSNESLIIALDEQYVIDSDSDLNNEEEVEADKSQLMEYDKFYKEQFFKNDVFDLDYDEEHDKEDEDIKKEVKKMEFKKKLKEKRKLKEVNILKGLNTTELQKEIDTIRQEYDKLKNSQSEKINLIMNNTETLLYKGRLLNNYFNDKKNEKGIPHFSYVSEADKGAKEIIDFKPLRKEEQARRYYDRCCCLKCRKNFNKRLVYARFWCLFLVDNQIFDNFSLLIIILNTIFILISDPKDNNNIANKTDEYFLYWYTLECILKIIAYGFVLTENAYLKDYWNCLDFFVVFVGWISWILEKTMNGTKISGLAGLRAFRILRPLKTVKSVKGLRKLVIALLASISHLAETTIVLFFFFLIFAIAGVQMWQGLFLKRCMSLNYGYLMSLENKQSMCSNDNDCHKFNRRGSQYICVKGYRNPRNGVVNFDNVLYGFVTIFIMVTLEGWTNIYNFISRTFKDKIKLNPIIIFLYFHGFVIIGGFYLINLFLAVTNSEFEKVEVTRKELIGKKSFYQLIKSRYDLKEKEKQEKKKKERELKNKNLTKSVESLRELYFKVDDESYHIKKNKRDIPIIYQTVKDMYIMTNNNPEELYIIGEMIDDEETHLCKDIKKQQKEIDRLIDEKKKEERKSLKKTKEKKIVNNGRKTSTIIINHKHIYKATNTQDEKKEKEEPQRKVSEKEIPKPLEKIYNDAIEISIIATQKYLKDEMINFQKLISNNDSLNNLKQKIEKKEMEKFMQGQLITKPDLSYEIEIKEKIKNEKQNKIQEELKKKNTHSQSPIRKVKTKGFQRLNSLINRNMLKEIYKTKKYKNYINNELSFMTDLSLSNRDNSIDDNKIDLSVEYSMFDSASQYNTKRKINNSSIISESNSIIADKKLNLDDENIYNDITFRRPKTILPEIIKLKNDQMIKDKLQKMRDHFNLNNFLQKESLKGVPISTLGKRRSYLNFLKYTQEKNNIDEIKNGLKEIENETEHNKLDISLFNNDDISISDISIDEIEMLPKKIPQNFKNYTENVNIDEINKKLESNKYVSIAKKSILDKGDRKEHINLTSKEIRKFYKNLNYNLNKNIVIDVKPPRGRDNKALNRSHVFLNIEHHENEEIEKNEDKYKNKSFIYHVENDNNNKSLNDETRNILNNSQHNLYNLDNNKNNKSINHNINKHKEITSYIYKSPSIEKNINKFPKFNSKELIVLDENKLYTDPLTLQQEMVPLNLRGKKYYMNYMNNIIDKDLKVKDQFKVDHWKGEVLGKQIKYIHKKQLPESTEAYFFFNDKKLNLKKYKYEKLKHFDYLDSECAYLTHSLKNLPIQILEIMPPRMRDYGRYAVGKDINLGTLSSKGTSTNIVTKTINTNRNKSVGTRSKSSIILGSAFSNYHKIQDDLKYKKGFYDKIYKKIDDFNYRTLSHYFNDEESLYYKLTDDKRKEEKKKEKNQNKEFKIEVKSEIKNINIYDLKTNSHRYIQWSGGDVLYKETIEENREKWNQMIDNLENFNIIIWNSNPGIKRWQKVRYAFYLIATNQWFDYIILLVVVINAIFMSLDGNLYRPEQFTDLSISNYVFNSIFIVEFILKFIGLGPIVYFSDAFTYLDVLIIAFAIVDMANPTSSSDYEIGSKKIGVANLSFLRVFRIFRVLRLTKVLRRMKSMRLIIVSIKRALANVTYIICILLMFILIFELLGMSLLNGSKKYQSFIVAFYTTFQILTIENWNQILYDLFCLSPFSFFYLMIWIFIGNYIIFNLFISILLQSFSHDSSKDDDDETEDEKIEKMYALPDYLNEIKLKEKEHKNRLKGIKTKNVNYHSPNSSISGSNHNGLSNKSEIKSSQLNSSNSNIGFSSSHFNDTDNIRENSKDDLNIYTGVDKSIREWEKVNILFRKNECENSLYLIPQTNKFRIWCMSIIGHKLFDTIILIMILLSTARLIIDTFVGGYLSVLIFDLCDFFFNLVFLLECIAKIIALGFVMDEGSYVRDNWNKIDLIIVLFSLLDFYSLYLKYLTPSKGGSSLHFLKVLRLLRILRPLRFISHNGELKLIISSLFDSILPICNALLIVLVVFFMFSIVGISLFYSLYHNCFVFNNTKTLFTIADNRFSTLLIENNIKKSMPDFSNFCAERYNGIMDTGPTFKFSNILISLITAYVLSNTEGWPDIMESYTVFNQFYGIFFIVYLVVVSYFFLNLFTGIMFKYFNDAWTREQKVAEGDKKAAKYYDFLTQIEYTKPDYITYVKPPEYSFRYSLRNFVDSTAFDNFIMGIIFLNMISMACSYDDSPSEYEYILKVANWVFTGIFILECILKIIAYGVGGYFYYGWNKFDFFVVIASIADIVIANIDGIDAAFLKSFQIIRVLRVLRVTRVLRLVKALKGLEKLLQTLSWSISALANVFLLMFLIFCIFSILGCYLYDGLTYKKYQEKMYYMDQFYNLDNFYNGFLLVFKSATGEEWPNIMEELAFIDEDKFSEPVAYVYMLIMNFISVVIMLNLFLMVILQQYDDFTTKSYNPIDKFEGFCEEFKRAWNKYSNEQDKGYRIKKNLISNFFSDFSWKKLNFPDVNKLEYIKKYVLDLKLRSDPENYVYFHDVLYKIVVKQMGGSVDKTNPDNALIIKTEKKVGEYIKEMISKYIKSHKIVRKNDKNPFTTFNPLTSHLYFKISYLYLKTFINYYKDNSEIFKQQEHKVEYFDDEEEEESEDHIVSEKSEFMNDSRYDTEQLNLPTHERGVSINFNKKNAPSSIAGSSNYLTKSNIGISGIH